MKNCKTILIMILLTFGFKSFAAGFEKDVIRTDKGDLVLTFIGHGTLMMEHDGKVVHIDPVGQYADYAKLPKADLILVTHQHGDHLDGAAISKIKKENTEIWMAEVCQTGCPEGKVLKNGEKARAAGIEVEAVPAYNIVHKRPNGVPFHPKGEGNGYILDFAGTRVYVAGDTENIPEMKALKNITVAFLPMNLPYTMTPAMVADAARAFRPRILYPYHFGNTDPAELVKLLAGEKDVEVRIRKLQ